ncbi:MAG: hypothetical protein ACXQTS_04835 [Candidatus Methanospirareceae archaeon]
MLEVRDKRVEIKEMRNYGTPSKPSYSVHVEVELSVTDNPDKVHEEMKRTGIISRETIPSEVVSNLRGSTDNKPYYSSLILHEGEQKIYKVTARNTGGLLRRKIKYEPVIEPEELRFIHPVDFHRLGIKVLEWELHNYKHYFMAFIGSKRYESFDMYVKRKWIEEGGGRGEGAWIRINLCESALRKLKAPCSWYLKRLSCFENFNIQEEISLPV